MAAKGCARQVLRRITRFVGSIPKFNAEYGGSRRPTGWVGNLELSRSPVWWFTDPADRADKRSPIFRGSPLQDARSS